MNGKGNYRITYEFYPVDFKPDSEGRDENGLLVPPGVAGAE